MSSRPNSRSEVPQRTWPKWARLVVSLWLIYHLAAIVIGPLNLPPSILGEALYPYVASYHRVLYIGHPYKFFAPDPGPSHLIEYDVELADGSHVKERMPDRNKQWPRLLYHRHFMLTEFVGNMPPEAPAPNADPRSLTWEAAPLSAAQRVRVQGYADHLLHRYDARRVTLTLVMHDWTPMEAITRDHVSLNDERSFMRRPLGTYERGAP